MIAGEIAVRAARPTDAETPSIVVVAGNGRTRAELAVFDVRRDGPAVVVACLEGAIVVECQGDLAHIKAHQSIGYDQNGLGAISATDGGVVAAWRRGQLVFEDQPLSQVVREINRYRPGRIVLMSDDVGRLPLDATFRLDRIDDAVAKIARIFNLTVTTLPGGVVLLS